MNLLNKIKSMFSSETSPSNSRRFFKRPTKIVPQKEEKEIVFSETAFKIQMDILFNMDELECRINLPHRTLTAGIEVDYPDSEDETITHTLELWNYGSINIDGVSLSELVSREEAKKLWEIAETFYYKKQSALDKSKAEELVIRI